MQVCLCDQDGKGECVVSVCVGGEGWKGVSVCVCGEDGEGECVLSGCV